MKKVSLRRVVLFLSTLMCLTTLAALKTTHAQAQSTGGLFTAITPVRALDTAASSPFGPGEVRSLTIAGNFGVPLGTASVSLNVTAAEPSADTHLTVWPADTPKPLTSTLNVGTGKVRPNAVIVQLNGGAINIANFAGRVRVVVDVNGYFSAGTPAAGGFVGVSPTRILDTRIGVGFAGTAPLGPISFSTLQVGGVGGVPGTNVGAVVLNITATGPTETTYLSIFPADSTPPASSSLNPAKAETAANMVITPLSSNGRLTLYNGFGTVHVIVDVMGYFTGGTPSTGGFVPVLPARILDTRNAISLPPRGWRAVKAGGTAAGIPVGSVAAVAANLTVTSPTASSYVSAFPTSPGFSSAGFVPSVSLPTTSTLNFVEGQTVPNAAIIKVGPEGSFWLYNSAGHSQVLADVAGYWIGPTPGGNAPPVPAVGPGSGNFKRLTTTSGLNNLFWDTCRPIYWYFDPSNGGSAFLDDTFAAMDRIQTATGLPFIYGGFQLSPEPLDFLSGQFSFTNRVIFIRWRNSTQEPAFSPTVLGATRGYRYQTGEMFASLVTINTDQTLGNGFGPGYTWGATFIHEFGHSMGLDHSTDFDQIMYPSITQGQDEFSGGDLTGMRAVVKPGCSFQKTDGPLVAESSLVVG
jgi:hypothetical protein